MKPKSINFALTYKCNSRCRMCRVWDRKNSLNELSAKQFDDYLFNIPLINENIEHIMYTGGEFCLRPDAFEIVEISFMRLKQLKKALFFSNGLVGERLISFVKDILKSDLDNIVDKGIIISIDGIGKPHDFNRGIAGGYEKSMKTLESLADLSKSTGNFWVSMLATLGPDNCDQAPLLLSKAKELGVGIGFQYIREDAYFCNDQEKLYEFTNEQRKRLLKAFNYIFKEMGGMSALAAIDGLSSRKRRQETCYHIKSGFLLTPRGDIFPCGMLEKKEFFVGNIAEDGFITAWNKKSSNQFIKKMYDVKCFSCPIALSAAEEKESLRYHLKRFISKLI